MAMTIEVGDVVMAKKFARVTKNDIVESTVTFSAPKGHALVFLLLGVRDIRTKSAPFDAEAVLTSMGWKFVGEESAAVSLNDQDGRE